MNKVGFSDLSLLNQKRRSERFRSFMLLLDSARNIQMLKLVKGGIGAIRVVPSSMSVERCAAVR